MCFHDDIDFKIAIQQQKIIRSILSEDYLDDYFYTRPSEPMMLSKEAAEEMVAAGIFRRNNHGNITTYTFE